VQLQGQLSLKSKHRLNRQHKPQTFKHNSDDYSLAVSHFNTRWGSISTGKILVILTNEGGAYEGLRKIKKLKVGKDNEKHIRIGSLVLIGKSLRPLKEMGMLQF